MSTPTRPIYTTTTLPNGSKAVIYEGQARHLFAAGWSFGGDAVQLIRGLIVQLVEVDGRALTESDVDALPIPDFLFAAECLSSMLSSGVPGLPSRF